MKKTVIIIISTLLIALISAKGNSYQIPKLIFENQMIQVWDFLNETENSSDSVKVSLFKKKIIDPNRDKYLLFIQYLDDPSILSYISDLEKRKPEIKNICLYPDTNRIISIVEKFEKVYPDFESNIKIYLMPSFGWLFRCQTLVADGKIFIRLGLDELMKNDDKEIIGLIQHELFHVYHFQKSVSFRQGAEAFFKTNEAPQLYNLLWTEGIANYAVLKINPDYKYGDVVGMKDLVDQTQLDFKNYINILSQKLEAKDISGFFYYPDSLNPKIPVGCGYYFGMLIVEDVAKRYNQQDLVMLNGVELLEEIRKSIENLKQ